MAEFTFSDWNPTTGYAVYLGEPPWTHIGSVKKGDDDRWHAWPYPGNVHEETYPTRRAACQAMRAEVGA